VAGIEVVHATDVAEVDVHPIAGHTVTGRARLRRVSPAQDSLWLVSGELAFGATLRLPAVHGDEAVYVLSGELRVTGDSQTATCGARGTVVIEAGAHPVLTATADTRIVHVGPTEPTVPVGGLNGSPAPGGDRVHVVGEKGTYAAIEEHRDTHYYADSTCPTCRLTLLYTSRTQEHISATHSHSTDELIHLLWGELRLGSLVVRPGDTLAITKDRRYGFRSGPEGFAFLNYRRDASQQTVERGSPPRMEGGLVNGLTEVMDVVDIVARRAGAA
jgi:hypothetical protein